MTREASNGHKNATNSKDKQRKKHTDETYNMCANMK
jgi:hypothetical protein